MDANAGHGGNAALQTAAGVADPHADPRGFLRALYDTAVARAQPARVLARWLPRPPRGRTLVLGAGKAAAAMAAAIDAAWPADAPLAGLVVTRYGHVPPAGCGRIDVVCAAHPVPDAAGRDAAERIGALADGLGADDLALCVVSGGGSALLALPAPGVDFATLQSIHRALVASGAPIDAMNCVRKHLSALAGGRLALRLAPAKVVTLAISDVPGDDPAVIASGPTVADPTSGADALAVLDRHAIAIDPALRAALASGRLETPKPGDPRLAANEVHVVATPRDSLEAAAAVARAAGVAAHVLSDEIEGESRDIGAVHAALARAVARHGEPFAPPCVLLSGGETTVTLGPSAGRGGRASEFLLGCARALKGEPGVHVLAADTDGIDGSEDNAGAFVSPETLARAAAAGIDAQAMLARHASQEVFAALGDLVVTGPTYTNVNDFRALLITGRAPR